MADPDQDILDFYNQSHGSPSPGGSPTATMTPDPDQDILDFYNKSHSPTPTATTAPSRSPYTDKAVQAQSATLNPPEKPGIVSTIAGSAARGFLPGRAMLAAYPYGAVAGAAGVGALRGALVGAAVPIAGETGISEAIGGVIGGLIAGGIAAWGVHKLQTKAADVVSPEGVFGSKTEQAQVAAHPYAAIVGGGFSFGKPNPMNVYRAGRTLASKEGRAAMVAFTKTRGQGMNPQDVDEVGNVINVAMAGGLNSAFNVKDQIESGHFDPGQLAAAAATGLLFNQPWFHKPNPAAAAAAKTMAQFGVPGVGPSPPTAPPGIAAPEPPVPPGIVPPGVGTARPRVPGLLDFEIPPPVSETARAPEAPLPEAPIPRPGTEVLPEAVQPGEFQKKGYTAITPEGGEINAPQERPVTESRVEEHQRVPPGENVPAHPAEVRTEQGEPAGYRGRPGAETPEPVEPSARHDEISQRVFDKDFSELTPKQQEIIDTHVKAEQRGDEPPVAPEGELKTPYSIRKEGDLFVIKDSRDPTRVTSAPKRTFEEAQARKAVLDRTFEKNELARMQREHEAELLREAEGHQAKGGDELLDVVAQHGVPLTDPNYKGELQNLQEHFGPRGKYGQEKHRKLMTGERLNFGDVFQKDADSLDSLTQLLKEKGFTMPGPERRPVETIDDTIQLIDERLRSGKKVYGDEARAQALEEQSFQGPMYTKPPGELPRRAIPNELWASWKTVKPGSQTDVPGRAGRFGDIRVDNAGNHFQEVGTHEGPEGEQVIVKPVEGGQGPMRMKHPFGGFFGKKEPEPVKPIENPEVLHRTLEADKDKGVKVIESTGADNEPGEKILEMGMNRKQVARRLNKDAYEGSIVNVSVKELLQNSLDSVRAGDFTHENPGRIFVNVDPHAHTITVNDVGYGKGMTPETVEKAFFTIGGTLKETSPENTSGGIGVAKIAIMYGAKRLRLETVRDGIKSVVDASGEQIEDGFFKLVKTRTNEPAGTKVYVEIPETYLDDNGETRYIIFDRNPEFLKQPLFGPVEVIYNGAALPIGIHTKGWQKDNVFNFGWGHVDVYVDPVHTEQPKYKVMSAGLYQFDVSKYTIFGMNTENAIKHNMVFDVRSHVRADHSDYPFNNQREGFQPNRKYDVNDMWTYLQRQGIEQQLLNAKEDFKKIQVLPDVDIEKNLTPEQQAEIESAFKTPVRPEIKGKGEQPKSVTFTPDNVVTTDQGGKQTTQTRTAYGSGERTFQAARDVNFEKTKLDVSNYDPSKPLFHNNTNADYSDIHGSHELFTQLGNALVKFMRHVGDKFSMVENYGELAKTDPGSWFGGIAMDTDYGGLNMKNPFKSIWFNPGDLSVAGVHSPDAAASETMHTFLHEITHVPQRNEGAGFTWEMKVNYGRIKAYKVEYQKYEKILENIYTKYFDAIKAIRERHKSYDTANRSASFKSGDAVRQEQGESQAVSEGAPGEHAPEDVGVSEQGRTGAGRAGEADTKPGSLGAVLAGQKSGAIPGAEPAPAQVAAPAPQPEGIPAAAPVPEGVSGRGGVTGIRDTLAGIKEAAAQPPETPEQRQYAPPLEVQTGEHEVRPPTPSEQASPRRDMSDQEMSKTIENSLQRFHEEALTTSGTSSGGLSHNDIIDAGRDAIRRGVDPEAVAASRAIPVDQKYTVTRAHGEDLREGAERAEDLARRNPSQVNKDAADAAFADYSNWDREVVRPSRKLVEEQYPGIPPEEFNPRSMTDLRQQMFRQNNRDFTASERVKAEQHLKELEKTNLERNQELMKWDDELRKSSPLLVKDIKNGDELFEYVANVMKRLFPCS